MKKWQKLANEYIVSLFPVFMLVDTMGGSKFASLTGGRCDIAFTIKNKEIVFYFDSNKWQQTNKLLVKKIKSNPEVLLKIFKQIENNGKDIIKYCQEITATNLAKKSSKVLNSYLKTFIEKNIELYSYGLCLPVLDYQETTFFTDELTKILKKYNQEKYFILLTTPDQETYSKRQEIDLLKLLVEIKKTKPLYKNICQQSVDQLLEEIPNHPKVYKLLNQHTKKYCWVYYVYEGPSTNREYYLKILQEYCRQNIDPQKKLNELKKQKIDLIKKQNKIINSLSLDDYEKFIIRNAKQAVFYKAIRREYQSWSYYLIVDLLQEIAKRLRLSLQQVRMMFPAEIAKGLQSKSLNLKKINSRIKLVVYGQIDNKKFCYDGSSATAFVRDNFPLSKKYSLKKELTGTTAYRGKVTGVAKIINRPEEIKKMISGNILISAATNPNLMSAIRIAKAIITDEGGLTCHAAIVSRELQIPCVVGTKIATEVLKDGDEVEVDATNGKVKII
ncbi:MAG: PEP-utilizing enzyme [bacterium]